MANEEVAFQLAFLEDDIFAKVVLPGVDISILFFLQQLLIVFERYRNHELLGQKRVPVSAKASADQVSQVYQEKAVLAVRDFIFLMLTLSNLLCCSALISLDFLLC